MSTNYKNSNARNSNRTSAMRPLALAAALAGLMASTVSARPAAAPAPTIDPASQLQVPGWTTDYDESVRCMPSLHDAGDLKTAWIHPAELSLEEQEHALKVLPMHTWFEGDSAPDFLAFGATSFNESIACTPRAYDPGVTYDASVAAMPQASLLNQERLPEREVVEQFVTVPRKVKAAAEEAVKQPAAKVAPLPPGAD